MKSSLRKTSVLFPCFLVLFLCTRGSAPLMAQLGEEPLRAFRDSIEQRIETLKRDSSIFIEYLTLANYHRMADTARARLYLDKAAAVVEKERKPEDVGGLEYERARFLKRINQPEAARRAIDASIAAYERSTDTKYLAQSYTVSAEMHMRSGDTETAMKQFQEGIRLAREIEDIPQVATSLNSLGLLHRRVGNLDEALTYFREATEMAQKTDNRQLQSSIILNRAVIHKTRKEYLEALELYQEVMAISRGADPPDEIGMAYTHNNLSGVYQGMRQPERALAESRKAYDIFKRLGGPREQSAVLLGIGVNLADLGRHREAIEQYRRVLVTGKDFDPFLAGALKGMAQSYKALRQLDSTVHYLELEANLQAEIKEKQRLKALTDMEGKFQTAEKQREIDRLEFEERLSQTRIQRQRWIIGLGLVALGLVSLLLYRVFRQRKEIAEKSEALSKSLADKETLLKEIHHRVKNNLQMVSSLLSLQSRYVTDDTAVAALKMGNSRVRSMALIHQKLYMSDEVSTSIPAGEYLEKLLDELIANLTPPGLKLTTNKELEDLELDIDTMIPLGLIANELVTNALKYAFNGRDSGTIGLLLKREDGHILFRVSDDGVGTQINPSEQPNSFGYLLINSLSEQLEGKLSVAGSDGMTVTLCLPEK